MKGWTSTYVADRAAREGYGWVAVQAEEPYPGDIVGACHDKGVLCGIWEAVVEYGSPAWRGNGFDFYIGQVEGDGQYARLVSSIPAYRAAHPDQPAAVVSNYGGLNTPELARPLIDAGFQMIAESHVCEHPAGTLDAQIDYAHRVLGWPNPQGMCGLGAGCTTASYPGFSAERGDSWFAAENLWL